MKQLLVWILCGIALFCACAPIDGEALGTIRLAYEDDEPPDPHDALVVVNDLPWSMSCSEERMVHVRLRNVGGSIWNPNVFRLGAFPNLGHFSGPSRVDFASPVGLNGEVSFEFPLRAPDFTTNETTRWYMLKQQGGTQWFGEGAERTVEVTCSGEDFDAEVADSSFPTNVACGQTFGVNVTMRNIGNLPWLPEDLVALGAANDDDPFSDALRYPIDGPVGPGDTHTFHMNFTAPPAEAHLTTDWRMVRDAGGPWFGQTLYRTIDVNCEELEDDSQVSWNMPNFVTCMDHLSIQVHVRNTGTTTWRSYGNGQGYYLRLIPGSVPLAELRHYFPPNVQVPPNGTYTFQISVHAPAQAGHYPFGFQLFNSNLESAFGQAVQTNFEASCIQDASRVVEESLATQVGCGRPYPVRIRMRNTGLATWYRATQYALGGAYGSDKFLPVTTRVELPPNVAVPPNGEHVFEFMLTAPFEPRPNYLQSWGMVHGGDFAFFGDGVSKEVNVECEPDMADFVTMNLPESMNCGDSYPASITFRNMGSASWLQHTQYALGAVDGSDPFGPPLVPMPNDVAVQPGQSYTFAFNLVAPFEDRRLTSDWRLQHGNTPFGPVVSREIEVHCPAYGARMVSARMTARRSCDPEVDALVTIRNVGFRPWGVDISMNPDRFALLEAGVPSPYALVHEVDLAEGVVVRPGATHTFVVRLRRQEPTLRPVSTWWSMFITPGRPSPRPGAGARYFGKSARVRIPRHCNRDSLYDADVEVETDVDGTADVESR